MKAIKPALEVIAPPNIRDPVAIPMPDKTKEERKRRNDLFLAVIDAGGHDDTSIPATPAGPPRRTRSPA